MGNGIYLNDVPVDLFLKYFDQASLQDEEFNQPLYIKKSVTDENGNKTEKDILAVDSNNQTLYKDKYGFITTQSSYSNKFLNHQSAIRKSFAKMTDEMGWMFSAKEKEVVLVSKNGEEKLQYYVNQTTRYTYNAYEGTPESFDDNRKINYDVLLNGKEETKKIPVVIQDINKLPKYTVYISSISDNSSLEEGSIFYAPEIQARFETLKDPASNIDSHNAILQPAIRYIKIDDNNKIILNSQGEIKAGISKISAENPANVEKEDLKSYLVNYNKDNAQILIPWSITNDNINEYINKKVKLGLGNNNNVLNYKFIIKGDATSISTVKLKPIDDSGNLIRSANIISAAEIFDEVTSEMPQYYIQIIFKATVTTKEDKNEIIIGNIQRAKLTDVQDKLKTDDSLIFGSSLSDRDKPTTKIEYVKEKRYEAKTAIGRGILGFFRAVFNLTDYRWVPKLRPVYNEYSADYYQIKGPFKLPITSNTIAGMTSNINYFENPYYIKENNNSNAIGDSQYIQETITTSEVPSQDLSIPEDLPSDLKDLKLIKYLPSNLKDLEPPIENPPSKLKDLPLNLKEFKKRFNQFEDSLAAVRGSYIADNVFLNERRKKLRDSIKNIISGDAEEYNIENEMNLSDGLVGVYNYCKGFDRNLKEAAKHTILKDESNLATSLLDFDSLDYKVILEKKKVVNNTSANTNISRDTSAIVYRADNRGLLQRVFDYEKYPMNIMYEKEPANLKYEVDMKNLTIDGNINKKINSLESRQRDIMQGQYTHQLEDLLNIGITSIAEYLNNEKYKEYILKLKDTDNSQYGKKLDFFASQEKPAVPEDNVTEKKVLSYLDFDLDEAIDILMKIENAERWEVLNE